MIGIKGSDRRQQRRPEDTLLGDHSRDQLKGSGIEGRVEDVYPLRRKPGRATFGSIAWMICSGSVMSVPPQPSPGAATWK